MTIRRLGELALIAVFIVACIATLAQCVYIVSSSMQRPVCPAGMAEIQDCAPMRTSRNGVVSYDVQCSNVCRTDPLTIRLH